MRTNGSVQRLGAAVSLLLTIIFYFHANEASGWQAYAYTIGTGLMAGVFVQCMSRYSVLVMMKVLTLAAEKVEKEQAKR